MQKIIIKNFAPVKEAEIEVNQILVLIGEQASGKSTIAKLIYFFKSVREDLFQSLYLDTARDYLEVSRDLIIPIREKFYDFFGSTHHLPDFELVYYYDVQKDKSLRLTLNSNKKIEAIFSTNFLTEKFKKEFKNYKKLLQEKPQTNSVHRQLVYEQNRYKIIQNLSLFVNQTFNSYHDSALFVIAGRNATVSYSDLFEKYFFASLQSKIEENKRQAFSKKEQTIDEILMFDFIERISKIKNIFKKYGDIEGLIATYWNTKEEKKLFVEIQKKINSILKGDYSIDQYGEKIILDKETGRYVLLNNASSGQQEIIRILQDLFLVLIENQKGLRIIEEPEAHLFPKAQKLVIELLALFANQGNEIIITTHSPYVLTVFNNLLFANRVVAQTPNATKEVDDIIDESTRLESANFSAYALKSHSDKREYCKNIKSSKTGLIQQNYLDTVSEMLSDDFNQLYSIHARSIARR